ncbi:ras-related protein Rab-3-like [Oppia nitens]|uniref:ras-related protein Rab-3-like n=1 Tax=Oppia nitens TaxID=1686743 RepID=UPI0023DB49BB|nr:ras-related protein Rab-3-like [Oppia nitens]
MYDVSDQESFDMIEQWLQLFSDNAPDRAQVVLVGNKCDISGDYDDNQHKQQPKQRVISYEMGRQLADKLKLDFYETSVKHNINVDKVFDRLVDIICDNHMVTKSREQLLTDISISTAGTVVLGDNNRRQQNIGRKKFNCC